MSAKHRDDKISPFESRRDRHVSLAGHAHSLLIATHRFPCRVSSRPPSTSAVLHTMSSKSTTGGTMSPNRVLPYTLLVTIGPSVTAATSLFVVVSPVV